MRVFVHARSNRIPVLLKFVYSLFCSMLNRLKEGFFVVVVFKHTQRKVLEDCFLPCSFPLLSGRTQQTQTGANHSFEFHIAVQMALKGFYKFMASII